VIKVGRATRGCGCAIAVLAVFFGAGAYLGYKYALPWWLAKPPPASGGELQVHVLDVGPIHGDSILIISPEGTAVLLDAGDTGKGKVVLKALQRYNVQQLDYFIASHPHPDHLGGATEVIKGIKVLNVIDNGLPPTLPESLQTKTGSSAKPAAASKVIKFYDDYREVVNQSGARYEKAVPGKQYFIGGGARLTLLGPTEPLFTREQLKTGGNEPNTNSIVARLDYGDFSMLLPGDAEEQTEHRMVTRDLDLRSRLLKVAHHGSRYATSTDFINRVRPEVAIISCGEWNRYGHPSQAVLDRLRDAKVRLYRTDLHGEISIKTRGQGNDYVITTAKEAGDELWVGRVGQKDDSSRSGFIAYGDFGPPPKSKKPSVVNGTK
jgi:competence protein ComEC